jgi:peroxiredoxin
VKHKSIILSAVFIAGIIIIYLLAAGKESTRPKALVGLDAPLFQLKDINDKNWKLSDLKGKVVLLNFWASWCESCLAVNSSIQNLLSTEKDSNIVYISILYKDNPSKAKEYMKKNGFDFPVLIDNQNIARTYGIGGVPETFIINRKGVIKEKVVGPIKWDSPMIKTAIRQLISE